MILNITTKSIALNIFIIIVTLLISSCSESDSDSKEVDQAPMVSPIIEKSTVNNVSPENTNLKSTRKNDTSNIQCDGKKPDKELIMDVIGNDHLLYTQPNEQSPALVNNKASETFGETIYQNIDTSTRVKILCDKGEWVYVQLTEPDWLTHIKGWTKREYLKNINRNSEPTKAVDSTINMGNLSTKSYTSENLTKADLAWHAINTYGFECSEVITKEEMTKDGYFIITCANNLQLKVYPRQGQHPSITEYLDGTKNIDSTSNADIKTTNVEDIEIGLINALKLNKETSERLGDSGKAIQGYIKKGLVTRKPTRRFDYTDYRLLKKPAKFMGHDLAVIEEEYMSEWVGCCVSEGTGVTVKVVGNTENLKQFAKENGCSFSDNVDLQKILIDVGIKAKVFPEHYASLSCRMRDMDMSSNINNSSNKKSNIEFKLLTDVDKTPPSIGRCIWLSCSWGKPLSVRVLQKSLEQVILEVELLGGESTHEKVEDYPTTYKGVDIKWNKEPHKVIITCSYKHPSTSLDGQVSELPLNSKGVPGVLESATNLYFQFCHSYDGNNPIEKFGYNVVE